MSEKDSKSSIFEKLTPALLVVTIGLAFLVGVLWQKVTNLEGGKTNTNLNANVAADNAALSAGKLEKDAADKVVKPDETDHVKGSLDADIILLEYSDLQCPFCQSFHSVIEQAVNDYNGKVAWVYRHLPLETIHPQALPAALAAECVNEFAGKDAFWKFVDEVFADQDNNITDDGLKKVATSLGVSEKDYSECIVSNRHNNTVQRQAGEGEEAGVTGTPATFVINKKGEMWLIPGSTSIDSLKQTIEEALGN